MALIPSARYPSQTDADANYPHGKARNAGTFQDGTGTPLERDWVNDLWGFEQSLLDAGGVTPSGAPDDLTNNQYVEAIQNLALAITKNAITRNMMQLRQVGVTTFTDTSSSMAAYRLAADRVLIMKAGANGVHRGRDSDDGIETFSQLTSITSFPNDAAYNGSRLVVIGTGGNRCCFSTDGGSIWTAGSDPGAVPHRIIYNHVHTRFMLTYASGVAVAQDVDAASTWSTAASTLTSGGGGIAYFGNGDTLVCGLDGSSDVAISRSQNGGATWATVATVPSATSMLDGGTIVGTGGPTIYHVGRRTGGNLRVSATDNTLSWTEIASLSAGNSPSGVPRILADPDNAGLLVVLASGASSTVAFVSRDEGNDWFGPFTYRSQNHDAFALVGGRLFVTFNGTLFATDYLV